MQADLCAPRQVHAGNATAWLRERDGRALTDLYHLISAIREGTLPPADEARAVRARARIVAKLHDDLDRAVAAAYGWD